MLLLFSRLFFIFFLILANFSSVCFASLNDLIFSPAKNLQPKQISSPSLDIEKNQNFAIEENNNLENNEEVRYKNVEENFDYEKKLNVLIIGDKIAEPLIKGNNYLDAESQIHWNIFAASNYSARLLNFSSLDIQAEVSHLLTTNKPQFIIIALGSADASAIKRTLSTTSLFDSSWNDSYRFKFSKLLDEVVKTKTPFAVLGLVPSPSMQESNVAWSLNLINQQTAQDHGGKFIDIWKSFSDDYGRFSLVGFSSDGRIKPLRYALNSGFTSEGQQLLAKIVRNNVHQILGVCEKNNQFNDKEHYEGMVTFLTPSGIWDQEKEQHSLTGSSASQAIATSSTNIDLKAEAPFGRADNSFKSPESSVLAKSSKIYPTISPRWQEIKNVSMSPLLSEQKSANLPTPSLNPNDLNTTKSSPNVYETKPHELSSIFSLTKITDTPTTAPKVSLFEKIKKIFSFNRKTPNKTALQTEKESNLTSNNTIPGTAIDTVSQTNESLNSTVNEAVNASTKENSLQPYKKRNLRMPVRGLY